MIENYNESKSAEIVDYKKFIGVGSVNVLCVNPDNAKLRMYGWNIPDNADEPQYVITKERDGKMVTSTRIRILVQIMDMDDKPIVPVDYWISRDFCLTANGEKAKIIDDYGRTAWGNKEEIRAHKIPQYKNGEANIGPNYRVCHRGEEELTKFIFRYLNITPLQVFSRSSNSYENTKNPGKFAFDDWNKLCEGNVKELEGYFKLQPENQMKMIFGIRTNDDNHTYQTFINDFFISNLSKPDRNTNEYTSAKNIISKYFERHTNSTDQFSAEPIKVWSQTATTDITDNSGQMFDDDGNFIEPQTNSDPFGDFPM